MSISSSQALTLWTSPPCSKLISIATQDSCAIGALISKPTFEEFIIFIGPLSLRSGISIMFCKFLQMRIRCYPFKYGQKSLALDTTIRMWQLLFAEKQWPLMRMIRCHHH
ncbi:hypothetical protein HYC85_006348 [Camellia sinensis]|uniref:Uncharacterized protein n=1 Tax=Camellia sinensis TaxID=4442 RepID=A0A7J7HKQ8_CAMSI|nr:hypothetical protein HYC85_006348 [Camellia sinensis]